MAHSLKKCRKALSNSTHDSDNEDAISNGSNSRNMLDREDTDRKNKEQLSNWECTGFSF